MTVLPEEYGNKQATGRRGDPSGRSGFEDGVWRAAIRNRHPPPPSGRDSGKTNEMFFVDIGFPVRRTDLAGADIAIRAAGPDGASHTESSRYPRTPTKKGRPKASLFRTGRLGPGIGLGVRPRAEGSRLLKEKAGGCGDFLGHDVGRPRLALCPAHPSLVICIPEGNRRPGSRV